jgi:hypothetical protein
MDEGPEIEICPAELQIGSEPIKCKGNHPVSRDKHNIDHWVSHNHWWVGELDGVMVNVEWSRPHQVDEDEVVR